MKGCVFINYRRSESQTEAEFLYSALTKKFGKKHVFIDRAGIDGGEAWLAKIESQLANAEGMIVLIGPSWIHSKSDKGSRRLDDLADFVRFEIAQALHRQLPIVPVLHGGANMPTPDQLPSNIIPLSLIHAIPLSPGSLQADAGIIVQRLDGLIKARRPPQSPWPIAGYTALLAVMIGIAAGPDIQLLLGDPFRILTKETTLISKNAQLEDTISKLRVEQTALQRVAQESLDNLMPTEKTESDLHIDARAWRTIIERLRDSGNLSCNSAPASSATRQENATEVCEVGEADKRAGILTWQQSHRYPASGFLSGPQLNSLLAEEAKRGQARGGGSIEGIGRNAISQSGL